MESSADAATVKNLIWETRTLQRLSFLEMMDEQDFRCKELSHLVLSSSVDGVLEGSVLLHFSVQLTRKQVEVGYNYTLPRHQAAFNLTRVDVSEKSNSLLSVLSS